MNQREQLRQLVFDVSTYLEDDVFNAVCGSEEELDQLVEDLDEKRLPEYIKKYTHELQEREYELAKRRD